jgi:hypothetical protein
MAPAFDRLAQMPWPIACCASSGTRPFSSALVRSCSRCASRVRRKIGWRQEDLSKASGVGIATIHRIEKAGSGTTGYVSTLSRIQTALESAGVLFIDDDGSAGVGVRLAKTRKKRRR